MRRFAGIVLGLCALPVGLAVGITFAAGVNLHYAFHPVYFVWTAITVVLALPLGRASLLAFGVGRRRAVLVPVTLTLAWTVAFFAFSWFTFPNSGAAVRKNDVVLQTIPVYAGLRLARESTFGHYEGDMFEEGFISPPDSFETTWIWSVRNRSSTGDVAAWYVERLRAANWIVERDDAGEGSIFLIAHRRGVDVEVDVRPRVQETDPAKIPADERTTPAGEVDAVTGF
jgi:hypothetical protein